MNKTAFLYIGLAVVILIGLFLVLRPEGAPTAGTEPQPAAAASEPESATKPRVYAYRVEQGQRVAGPAAIRVQKGESVILQVTSDVADELHLHGYDLHASVPAGKTTTLSFNATHAGRFELELHRRGIELATLEVQPR